MSGDGETLSGLTRVGDLLDQVTPAVAKPPGTIDPEVVRLAKLVKLMREVQKRFFAGDKSRVTVALAKEYEARVDKAVAWVLRNRAGFGERQPGLFGDAGGPGKPPGAYGPP